MNYLVARVSDPTQIEALPAQKQKLLDYAKQSGWLEHKDFEYIEFNETAFKENRKTFRELVIDPVRSEQSLAIVVFDKIDRFSRDSSSDEKKALTDLFRAGRIEIHFPSDNLFIRKDSPAPDLFRLDIGVALAGYYSASIRDNVNRRFNQMLNDGIWPGKAPIGYINTTKKDAMGKDIKTVEPDPVRAPLIHKAFEIRANGMPYRVVAKEMKKLGLRSNNKTLKPVTTNQWERVFSNKFYYGTMTRSGKDYKHNYEPIVEKSLWDAVQQVKLGRGKSSGKYFVKPRIFKNIRCGTCGYMITFFEPAGKPHLTYGHCTEYGGKHKAPYIREEEIIEQVREALRSITVPKSEIPNIVNEIEENSASEQKYHTATVANLKREHTRLETEIEELFRDRKRFESRPDIFEKMINDINERQKDILEQISDHDDGDKAFKVGALYIIELCSRAVELFDAETTTIEQKRFLVDFVFENMKMDGHKLFYNAKEPFETIQNHVKSLTWGE